MNGTNSTWADEALGCIIGFWIIAGFFFWLLDKAGDSLCALTGLCF